MAPSPTLGLCKTCGCKTSKTCARCTETYYCRRDCQVKDWKNHKFECLEPTPAGKILDVEIFPDEIWFKVLEFLPTKDILRGFALVCRHFNRLSKKPNLIKEIHLSVPTKTKLDLHRLKKDCFDLIMRSTKSLTSLILDDGNFSGELFVNKLSGIEKAGGGYVLATAINYCENLRSIKLQNISHLFEDEFIDEDALNGMKFTDCARNSKFVVAIANKCTKLEHIDIKEAFEHLSQDALKLLIRKRGPSLKSLKINGSELTNDETLKRLHICQNLEEFAINNGHKLGPRGCLYISKLRKLKSLELSLTSQSGGLTAKDLASLFTKGNMPLLEKLSLAGPDPPCVTDMVVETIANNCPRLEYLNLYKSEWITNESIGNLLAKLANLHYLSIRKCYGIDLEVLELLARKSQSKLLLINTFKGLIIWKSATKECKLSNYDWSAWDAGIEMQERAFSYSDIHNHRQPKNPYDDPEDGDDDCLYEFRPKYCDPNRFFGATGMYMTEGSFYEMKRSQDECGDEFDMPNWVIQQNRRAMYSIKMASKQNK